MIETRWGIEKGLLGGPWSWPQKAGVALVLDGIAIDNLPRKLYEWAGDQPDADWLYAGTPWEPVKQCSPWLVHLNGPEDPVLKAYQNPEVDPESGYILVHVGSKEALADTLRGLLQVERVSGVPELLRIGHPIIARSVIGQRLLRRPSGHTISSLVASDSVKGQWYSMQRTAQLTELSNHPESPVSAIDSDLLSEFQQFDQRSAMLSFLRNADESQLSWLGPGSVPDHCERISNAFAYASDWSLKTPRARALFLELLQATQTRPWLGERLPETVAEVLMSRLPGVSSVEAALAVVEQTSQPKSNAQG